ncbi:Zinc finger CCCH domain-containing protein [Ancistrocladus abbreviatus]
MTNQLYTHNPSYGAGVSSVLSSRSIADPYLPESPFLSSSRFLATSDNNPVSETSAALYSVTERTSSLYADSLRYSESGHGAALGIGGASGGASFASGGYSPVAARIAGSVSASATSQPASWPRITFAGSKRPSEVIYNQSVLGAHNTLGQNQAWLSTNSLAKRPRFDTASSYASYPQRPGEKACAHYMLTRICKFGDSCKFDHPIWVPEGGIPDWKEVQQVPQYQPVLQVAGESFPQRPGEPDCPFFLKTQQCKFGPKCKFNHPNNRQVTSENVDSLEFPERPSEPQCSYYMKTGKCKFGANCKFHHPRNIQMPSVGLEAGKREQTDSCNSYAEAGDGMHVKPLPAPAILHNSQGLPVRMGEVDCPFYMKNGSCKYGVSCRYNHPERNGHSIISSPALNIGVVNPAASILQALDPRLAQTVGAVHCPFYMKTGICKYGVNCKFDHPPPGEVMAMAVAQGTSTSVEVGDKEGGEKEDGNKVEATEEQQE